MWLPRIFCGHAFAAAVSSNKADAISCSWGEWEEFLVQGNSFTDPDSAGDLSAMHNLLPGGDNGLRLLPAKHGTGNLGSVSQVRLQRARRGS